MQLDKRTRFKKTLTFVRLFAFPAVAVLIICIFILLATSFIKLGSVIQIFLTHDELLSLHASEISANMLSIIDIYLLIIVTYVMMLAIYKFFIGDITVDAWLELNDLDDLKAHISKVIVLFLAIFTVKKIVEWGDRENILYFGITIGLVCTTLIWYSMFLRKCRSAKKGKDNSQTESHI